MHTGRKKSFLHHHSLSFATAAILSGWIVLYSHSDSKTHIGSFFGNAIADWTGLLVTVLATKYFYEIGSAESRRPEKALPRAGKYRLVIDARSREAVGEGLFEAMNI